MALEIQRAEHVPEGPDVEACVSAADALVRANNSNARVFEGGEHGGKKPGRGPKDVVIEEDSDLCVHVLETVCDLDPLVSDSGSLDANACAWEPLLVRANNGFCSFSHFTANWDNDYCTRGIQQAGSEAFLKISVLWINSWQDDCAIGRTNGRSDGNRSWPIETPERNEVDDETKVSEDEQVHEEGCHTIRKEFVLQNMEVAGKDVGYEVHHLPQQNADINREHLGYRNQTIRQDHTYAMLSERGNEKVTALFGAVDSGEMAVDEDDIALYMPTGNARNEEEQWLHYLSEILERSEHIWRCECQRQQKQAYQPVHLYGLNRLYLRNVLNVWRVYSDP